MPPEQQAGRDLDRGLLGKQRAEFAAMLTNPSGGPFRSHANDHGRLKTWSHRERLRPGDLIKDGVWQVSVAGRFGDYPPDDQAGFMEFVKTLPTPKLYEILEGAERVEELSHYRFPTSILPHSERLGRFPERLIVLGDAICSFNPVYGQGMSSAILQADALGQILAERASQPNGLDAIAAAFFPRAAEVVSTPWTLAANFDFANPQTEGERPQMMSDRLRYFLNRSS